jgi:tetratricopeptide (TPR) repeat protein
MAAALTLACLGATAHAQPAAAPNPIVQHYRAYQAALDRQDLPAAEREAAAALQASVERYGDEGRTAVLALNLAGVRLMQKRYAEAIEPAAKAVALAESQGAATGVDPLVARLMLGRAELRQGGAAVERLATTIERSLAAPDVATEAYDAAVELGAYAFDTRQYGVSHDAWRAAVQLAPAATNNSRVLAAAAQIGQAGAGIMQRATTTDGARAGVNAAGRTPNTYAAYGDLLVDAMDDLHDVAMQAAPDDGLTLAQNLYGQAMAWRGVVQAKLASDRVDDRPPGREPRKTALEIGAARFEGTPCVVQLVAEPPPRFPNEIASEGGVGSVVLKLKSDAQGAIERVQPAGAVGGQAFVDAVVAVAGEWRYDKGAGSPAGCRMQMERFVPVIYRYR